MSSKNKKKIQLGLDASTAAHRLRIDLLFRFAKQAGHKCFRCGKPLTRKTFSIDHKKSWLNSKNPAKLFFDLSNIAFSHRACNSRAGHKPNMHPTREAAKQARLKSALKWKRQNRPYDPAERRARYAKYGY